jgi:DNA-binding NtrC family response regulator
MVEEVRVLYVDDDELALDMRSRHLEECDGIVVVTETDPTAAIDVLARGTVDCVLSDFDMPTQNGLEFLESVRAELPAMPFILFTSVESRDIAEAALEAGATDFVPKSLCSISYRLLANRIRAAVEYHRTREQSQREVT